MREHLLWEGHEIGEYSPDNKSWNKFFEMTLRKVK